MLEGVMHEPGGGDCRPRLAESAERLHGCLGGLDRVERTIRTQNHVEAGRQGHAGQPVLRLEGCDAEGAPSVGRGAARRSDRRVLPPTHMGTCSCWAQGSTIRPPKAWW